VARVDIDTGELTIISPRGDAIVSPDDLAFDSEGILYATECMDARVTALKDGRTWVLEDDLPGANGIAIADDRIFVGQFMPGGGLFEIFRDDKPRVQLAEGLDGPNGFCVAPDGYLYFSLVFPGEIRRIPMEGGKVELVADGLGAPSSCRVGPDGSIYFSQGGSGRITRINPETGDLEQVYEGRAGIDNFDINRDGRICISYYPDGAIYEVTGPDQVRELVAPALMAPYGIAVADGAVHIADGLGTARLTFDGTLERTGKITDEGFPGYVRGLAPADPGVYVTNSTGLVGRWQTVGWTHGEAWADGLGETMGVARVPGADDRVIVAVADRGAVMEVSSSGTARVLADDFDRPVGVAVSPDGDVFATDEGRGTLDRIATDGHRSTVVESLNHPHDLVTHEGSIMIVDAGARRVVSVDVANGALRELAIDVPTGDGAGGVRATLNGLPNMIPGPISPFAGIDFDERGRLHVAGDAHGVIVTLERS
jgi:sugar lactone lactonase YvrE